MYEVSGSLPQTIDLYKVFVIVISLTFCTLIANAIYNVFFHPLRKFPGPLWHKISRVPYFYKHINGTLTLDMLDLHNRYGNVVRVAPDELAYSHPDAWKAIMAKQESGRDLPRAVWFYNGDDSTPKHILNESYEQSGRIRRQLAHGLSDKGIRDQEPIINHYVDLFIQKLRERCESGQSLVTISDWYNYCTFDIIGDLAFGESFGCLDSSSYHAWIAGIFQNVRLSTIMHALTFFPFLKIFFFTLIPKAMREGQELHLKNTRAKMIARMETKGERADLIEGLLKSRNELGLTTGHLIANAEILIIAGSETTATLLSGATYFILRNPSVYEKLREEVRNAFDSDENINLVSVGQLTYMLTVLYEALRLYPPLAGGIPRQVPKEGAQILDQFVPADTYVAIHQWALYHREDYFLHADEFHPERFLNDPEYSHDRKDALQPFHVGPHNCLGRNLAFSESRLILARTIYNFDMRLDESCVDWIKQRNYILWQKGPLMVHLSLAEKGKAI